jgi:methionyl-tRNA synthetase
VSSDALRIPEPFYITTPIYYVNAVPHLGTFYSTVVADALARFHRARGDETFFLTGLDEHGQKIERIAAERGVPPQEYCDGIALRFQETWKRAEISNDDFIRTTSGRHKRAVAEMWARLEGAGDIYPAEYDGMYCVGCEDWKSEDDVVVVNGEKLCPIHQRPVERVKETNYFFRLSKYQDYLLELYQRPGFIRPESRKNEVASFVNGGLRDISISRLKKSVGWAIPVPGAPDHTIYVWIDALTNYLTVLGGPDAVAAGGAAAERWNACTHLIAKDILRFHAVYWPAMLKSAGLPPPKGIFCHGYLTVKGQKISKSIPATKVDPIAVAEDLDAAVGMPVGIELLRYFVLREYQLGGDGDFTYESLLQRYESDLGNDLGNLLNRTINMAHQYLAGRVDPSDDSGERGNVFSEAKAIGAHWEKFEPAFALDRIWNAIRNANRYIDASKPWVIAKLEAQTGGAPQRSDAINKSLAHCCGWLRAIAHLVAPVMPEAAKKILAQLGLEDDARWRDDENPSGFWPGATLGKPVPLFPRIDPDRKAALLAKWQGSAAVPAAASPANPVPPASASAAGAASASPTAPTVTGAHGGPDLAAPVDKADFDKLDLRAARVLACERVPKTEKLLKLTLDIGAEQRTVVSGIAGAYAPETLVGRTVVYLANLKPAKIRGVVSQGMILAAGDADVLALTGLDRDVPPGTRIR